MLSSKFPIGVAAFVSLFSGNSTVPMAAAGKTTSGGQVMTQKARGEYKAKHLSAKTAQERNKRIEDRRKAIQQSTGEHGAKLPDASTANSLPQGLPSIPSTGGAVGGPYIGLHYKGNE